MRQPDNLTRARTALVVDHPFFGTLALSTPTEVNDSVPTAATDGTKLIFNPAFLATLNVEETVFLVAHECMHIAMEHCFRRGERDPRKWNSAGDYVINHHLIEGKVGKMPKGGLHSADLFQRGKGMTDAIYDLLPDPPDDENTDFDKLLPPEDGDTAEKMAATKQLVAQAAQAARMQGKLPASLERLVSEMLNPKVSWRDVLERFLIKVKDEHRSYARFNRRFLSQGMYLPSQTGEALGDLCVAVDCSGSISDAVVNQFAAELNYIQTAMNPSSINVLYFDSSVAHVETYQRGETLDIKPHGGGGTDFAPVFKEITMRGLDPIAIVFLTDLYCSSYGIEPDCPVLWVSNGANKAPFGEVVMV